MLVLSRKTGESIQIDSDIFVTVTEVKGGRVRIAIEAPRNVRIIRKEIIDREFSDIGKPMLLDLPLPANECLN